MKHDRARPLNHSRKRAKPRRNGNCLITGIQVSVMMEHETGRRRRVVGDTLISMGALAALLTTLVLIDGRVREQVSRRIGGGHASTDLVDAGSRVRDLASVVMDAARDQSIEHAPMFIFVLVATVLVLFMLRT